MKDPQKWERTYVNLLQKDPKATTRIAFALDVQVHRILSISKENNATRFVCTARVISRSRSPHPYSQESVLNSPGSLMPTYGVRSPRSLRDISWLLNTHFPNLRAIFAFALHRNRKITAHPSYSNFIIKHCNDERVKKFIVHWSDFFAFSQPALNYCAENNHLDLVVLLQRRGSCANKNTVRIAAIKGNYECLRAVTDAAKIRAKTLDQYEIQDIIDRCDNSVPRVKKCVDYLKQLIEDRYMISSEEYLKKALPSYQ